MYLNTETELHLYFSTYKSSLFTRIHTGAFGRDLISFEFLIVVNSDGCLHFMLCYVIMSSGQEYLRKWQHALSFEINNRIGISCYLFGLSFSINISLRENAMKILYHWHISPVRLARKYQGSSNHWASSNEPHADIIHIWKCIRAMKYWKLVSILLLKGTEYNTKKYIRIILVKLCSLYSKEASCDSAVWYNSCQINLRWSMEAEENSYEKNF